MIKQLLSFIYLLVLTHVQVAECSHFRGGSITAIPVNWTSTQVTFEFTMNLAWRLSTGAAYFCNQTTVDNNGLTGPRTDKLLCRKIGNQTCSNTIATCDTHCKFFSPTIGGSDWTYGEKKFFVTTPFVQYYEASFKSVGWMALAGGGSGGAWEVRLRIDTRARSDTGTINTTPITTIPPLVTFRQGAVVTIPIIWADSDVNDDVRCRWATLTNEECGGVCQNNPNPANMPQAVPPASLNETSCLLTFDGTQSTAKVGFYAVALQIEDFMTPQDTVPLSSIPLQFLIKLVSSNSSCTQAPMFIGDRQAFGCYASPIGIQFSDRMVAQPFCPGATIIEIQVLGLSGSTVSSLNQVGTSQWAVNVSWTPKTSQYGPNVVCGLATDSTFLIAFNCYTVIAGVAPPSLIQRTATPTGLVTSSMLSSAPNGKVKWTIDLDQSVKAGVSGKYIRINHQNGTLFTRIDSTSNDYSINNYTLEFYTTNQFPVDNYYVTFDFGVVGGLLFCNPNSNSELSRTYWTFSVNETVTATTTTTATIASAKSPSTQAYINPTGEKQATEDSSNMGAIIGGAVGGLAACAGAAAGVALAIRYFKRKRDGVKEMDNIRIIESPTPSSSDSSASRLSMNSGRQLSLTSTSNVSEVSSRSKGPIRVEMGSQSKTRMSMNSFEPKPVPELPPLKPPPKNKMMGPLVKNKNFNYPLEEDIKAYIQQHK